MVHIVPTESATYTVLTQQHTVPTAPAMYTELRQQHAVPTEPVMHTVLERPAVHSTQVYHSSNLHNTQ